jgi:15-hydroxyprostaglandin dehydrogenase (NAD)
LRFLINNPEMSPVAIVTGACSGIGLAMTKDLLARGYKVFMGDINPSGGHIAASLPTHDTSLAPIFVQTDVTVFESQARLLKIAFAHNGRIDVFLANAGIDDKENIFGPPADPTFASDPTPYDTVTAEVDFISVLHGLKLMLHYTRRARYEAERAGRDPPPTPRMVVTSSTFGLYPFPTNPVYAASKHATRGLVLSTGARMLAEEGLSLNAIMPAFVPTGLAPDGLVAMIRDRGYVTPMETIVKAFGLFLGDGTLPDGVERVEPRIGVRRDGPLSGECAEVSIDTIYLRGSVPFANESQEWFTVDPEGLWTGAYGRKRAAEAENTES